VLWFPAFPPAPAYDPCYHPQCRRQSCITSQSLFLTSIFPSRYIMAIIIWCRRSASALLLLISSLTPQGKSPLIFASCWTFILFYLVSLELISLSCKKHSPPFLFFCIPFWSFWRPLHSRRTDDLCYPDPHIPRFNRTHILFCPFSCFSPC